MLPPSADDEESEDEGLALLDEVAIEERYEDTFGFKEQERSVDDDL